MNPCYGLVGFAAGTLILQFLPSLPDVRWLTLSALLLFALERNMPPPSRTVYRLGRASVVICAFAVGGASLAAWRATARLEQQLPHVWEGADLGVTGVVVSLPSRSESGSRFEFAVEKVDPPEAVVPPRIALSWFARSPDVISTPLPSVAPKTPSFAMPLTDFAAVHAGARWQLRVRLKRPHGTLNFAGFDVEAWLFERNLRAVGYVREDARNREMDRFVSTPRTWIERARETVRARIDAALPDARYAGVIEALAIGDQQSVPEAQWRVFNRTGISHLISISGLHITVFAMVVGTIALAIARRFVKLTSRFAARKVAVVVGAIAATVYTMLAGAEVPAQRTLVMLCVAATGLLLARPASAPVVWLWSLGVVLAIDPWAAVAPGFWLSFGAVGLLLYAGIHRMRPRDPRDIMAKARSSVGEAAHAQWVVTLGLIPLTLALFQQVSLVAPLANAVAIPVVTFGVVSLALLGVIVPIAWAFVGAHAVFAVLMRYLEWLSQWPDAAWQQHAPLGWTIAAGLAGTLWTLAPRGVPGRTLGIVWLLPMWLIAPSPPAEGRFRLIVLDVGQGLSSVIETHRHSMLYDTGPRYGPALDAGGRIVAPNLRAFGVEHLDLMIVSHADSDHSGGALSVIDAVPVRRLMSSLKPDHPIVERMREASGKCVAGTSWIWDGVTFSVLWPHATDYGNASIKTNDMSCVVRVEGAAGGALLTGDIEARDESALLISPANLHADVVVVPHHGSRTSSTPPFVEAIGASLAIFTAGYRNRFGHPRPDVVTRYRAGGTAVVRSDADGAVELELGGDEPLEWHTARVERRRYWHDEMEIP
ncbi:MAG TPA: DNA internalization-related competence protein ComEC/Rec2 [Casimicrobiaceae bacterium]|nr:DNA internalization-related competence protein ComEC/Rec2 [Casimicrobiaceae bacterium]